MRTMRISVSYGLGTLIAASSSFLASSRNRFCSAPLDLSAWAIRALDNCSTIPWKPGVRCKRW